jgi:hypothetical protein
MLTSKPQSTRFAEVETKSAKPAYPLVLKHGGLRRVLRSVNVRITVADYAAWRKFFDDDEARRCAGGANGVKQIYRDADDPNTVNPILEWDNAENARKFLDDPALREVMQKSGVIGTPAVRSILTRA